MRNQICPLKEYNHQQQHQIYSWNRGIMDTMKWIIEIFQCWKLVQKWSEICISAYHWIDQVKNNAQGILYIIPRLKVVHNNCLRGILLSAIVALKSIVSQRFSAVWRGLNWRTDPYWIFYHSLGTGLSAGNEAVYFVFRTEAAIAL